jgi:hypothetical protein
VKHDFAVRGGCEIWRRHAARAHHQLCEGVSTVSSRVLLQKRERFILNLRPPIAPDEVEHCFAVLVHVH